MDTQTRNNETIQNPETIDPTVAAPRPTFPQDKQPYPGTESEMAPKADHGEESYRGLGRLAGRCALITGGDSGIGRAVAIAYAREGANVAIAYLPEEEEDAEETANWVSKAGRSVVKLPADIRDEGVCQSLVERTFDELGDLNILVNNAAFQATHDSIAEFTTEEFDRTFKTNVYATFWLSKAALGRMKEGSAIINAASIQAFDPSPNLLAYAATKAAIANLSKSLSKIALKQGVRVNAVAPGPVWTPLIPATMPKEKVKEFGKNTAFGRPAQPAEIAPIFVFLASNESRFVSGEIYGATGSQTPLKLTTAVRATSIQAFFHSEKRGSNGAGGRQSFFGCPAGSYSTVQLAGIFASCAHSQRERSPFKTVHVRAQ